MNMDVFAPHALRKSAAYVLFVVPTSTSTAPLLRRTSGRRKAPPISMSWPRLTTTSRPRANVSRTRRTAAAQLRRDALVSAAALAGVEVEFEIRVAGAEPGDGIERGAGERCTAEVRMEQHAGRVHDADQPSGL